MVDKPACDCRRAAHCRHITVRVESEHVRHAHGHLVIAGKNYLRKAGWVDNWSDHVNIVAVIHLHCQRVRRLRTLQIIVASDGEGGNVSRAIVDSNRVDAVVNS